MSKHPADGRTIQSDRTLMAILDALYEVESAGVTELSEQLDVSKGTVHKHLKTLEEGNYVEGDDGTYRLGMRFFRFGGKVRNRNQLCFMAKERVETIAFETSELTKFAIEHDGVGVWMYFANDHYDMRRDLHVGGTFKLHQNATGKAILAELADERIHEIVDDVGLEAETERTVTDRAELLEEVREARERGVAQSKGEFRKGGISVAAPVRDPKARTVGAIAIAGPAAQTSPEELAEAHGERLQETAQRLELQLRYI
jgi:DNA-binding IclR family transcriptional regulator